jgi:hypothetical protein
MHLAKHEHMSFTPALVAAMSLFCIAHLFKAGLQA